MTRTLVKGPPKVPTVYPRVGIRTGTSGRIRVAETSRIVSGTESHPRVIYFLPPSLSLSHFLPAHNCLSSFVSVSIETATSLTENGERGKRGLGPPGRSGAPGYPGRAGETGYPGRYGPRGFLSLPVGGSVLGHGVDCRGVRRRVPSANGPREGTGGTNEERTWGIGTELDLRSHWETFTLI